MEESIHRFNVVMDIDESDKENKKCMDQFFGDHVEKKNSNAHPTVSDIFFCTCPHGIPFPYLLLSSFHSHINYPLSLSLSLSLSLHI